MTFPRPVLIVACIVAAVICTPVFFAAQFAASVLIYRIEELMGLKEMPPAWIAGVTFLGQFLSMLAAMGMTYGTFAGLRWVWRGTNFARK